MPAYLPARRVAHRCDRARRTAAVTILSLGALGCSSGESSSPGSLPPEPCSTEGASEACYPGEPATLHVGSCVPGSRSCVGGTWTACVGYQLPAAESCNGVDDDCNGIVDPGCPCDIGERPCYTGPAATNSVGACQPGAQRCDEGAWSSVCVGEVLPLEESCAGGDNDCNGIEADGCECLDAETRYCYSGPGGTDGVGPCHGVTLSCEAGAWPAGCPGEVVPSGESCNGADDDCDSQVDEDNPGGGGSCTTNLPGPCAQGVLTCSGGSLSCVSTAPTSDPACQPCVGCLDGHPHCDELCMHDYSRPGGDCAYPTSSDPEQCCECDAEWDCSGCLNGYPSCIAACQAAGYPTGVCTTQGSTDIYHCCFCFPY